MIDYETLCQSILDWREGKKPEAPPPPPNGAVTKGPRDYELLEPDDALLEPMVEQARALSSGPGRDDFSDEAVTNPAQAADPAGEAGVRSVGGEGAGPDTFELSASEQIELGGAEELERDTEAGHSDDFASFDPHADLAAFFRAEAYVTAVWDDDDQRQAALRQYGILDEQHFAAVTSSMERYFLSDDAQSRYGGLDGIMQLKAEQQAVVEGEMAGELGPVNGIPLQKWAMAQARIAHGAAVGSVAAELGLDEGTWQTVNAEWNERMSRDTTSTIATAYSSAFASGASGQFADVRGATGDPVEAGGDPVGDPPITMERWVELRVAQTVGHEQGRSADEVLGRFGMSGADWSAADGWWSQYLARHAADDEGALQVHYAQLQDHYESHYRSGA